MQNADPDPVVLKRQSGFSLHTEGNRIIFHPVNNPMPVEMNAASFMATVEFYPE
jgi:hypothetical protein